MGKKIIKLISNFIGIGILLFLIQSCEKSKKLPEVLTSPINDLRPNSVVCGGSIKNNGGLKILSSGLCWGTGINPILDDSNFHSLLSTGLISDEFTMTISGLKDNTTYFVRAFAKNKAGTGYGNIISFKTIEGATDIDGNVYHLVKIGTQVWMLENLQTTRYRNGDIIPSVKYNPEWDTLTTGAYYDFKNTSSSNDGFGNLYNWYTIEDKRLIAPLGWHVPSYSEMMTLVNYLGGVDIAGGKMKEKGYTRWNQPNKGATNESGFTSVGNGTFRGKLEFQYAHGELWNTTTLGLSAYCSIVYYDNTKVSVGVSSKNNFFAVRCIKD